MEFTIGILTILKHKDITDRLNWGANMVAEYGTHTIRVELGYSECSSYGFNTEFSPDFRTDADYLKREAGTEPYKKLFNDPRFSTYILTVTSFQGYFRCWAINGQSPQCNAPAPGEKPDYYTQSEAELEKQQFQNLAEYLIKTYPTKKFILFNWEADNDIDAAKMEKFGGTSAKERASEYKDFVQAKADGVAEARKKYPEGKVYSGLEVNCIRPGCIGGGLITNEVVPHINVDYLSFSAWTTVAPRPNDTLQTIADRLTFDFDTLLNKANQNCPGKYTTKNLVLGEFGYDRKQWENQVTPEIFFNGITTSVDKLEIPYVIYWQLIDNQDPSACGGPDPTRYGLKDKNLTETISGKMYREIIKKL